MCNYLIKTVKSTQNQAKVCQHPAGESETADGVCQETEREERMRRGKEDEAEAEARKWSSSASKLLSSQIVM